MRMIISHVGGDQTTYSLEQDEFSINVGCKPFKGFVLMAASVKAARARYASGMINWGTDVVNVVMYFQPQNSPVNCVSLRHICYDNQ